MKTGDSTARRGISCGARGQAEAHQDEASVNDDDPQQPKDAARDALFAALRDANPQATHNQLLAIIRAVDTYVAVSIREYDAL